MVDFNLIPNIQKIELFKAVAEPAKEFYRNPLNVEKFNAWLNEQKN